MYQQSIKIAEQSIDAVTCLTDDIEMLDQIERAFRVICDEETKV